MPNAPVDYDEEDDGFEEFDESWCGPSNVDMSDPYDIEYDVP